MELLRSRAHDRVRQKPRDETCRRPMRRYRRPRHLLTRGCLRRRGWSDNAGRLRSSACVKPAFTSRSRARKGAGRASPLGSCWIKSPSAAYECAGEQRSLWSSPCRYEELRDPALRTRSTTPPCKNENDRSGGDRASPPRLSPRFGGDLIGVRRQLIGSVLEELEQSDAGIVRRSARPVRSGASLRRRSRIRRLEQIQPERPVEALQDRERESAHAHVLVLAAVRIDLDATLLQEDAHELSERVEVQDPVLHAESVRLRPSPGTLTRSALRQRPARVKAECSMPLRQRALTRAKASC
jgi:hypothetical protein